MSSDASYRSTDGETYHKKRPRSLIGPDPQTVLYISEKQNDNQTYNGAKIRASKLFVETYGIRKGDGMTDPEYNGGKLSRVRGDAKTIREFGDILQKNNIAYTTSTKTEELIGLGEKAFHREYTPEEKEGVRRELVKERMGYHKNQKLPSALERREGREDEIANKLKKASSDRQ
jgi:hypothetical protein